MASSTFSRHLKGYDHQFIDQPPDDLLCLICLMVARDPQQITCCGKVLCETCLQDLKNYSNVCPQCRKPIVSFPDTKSKFVELNLGSRIQMMYISVYEYITGDRHIKSLTTKCDSHYHCQWIGELRSLDKHFLSCDFTLLPCPNQCKKDEEILKLLRKDIEKHKMEECPRRQYECPHCKETGEYQERTTTHLQKCPNIEIPCPNRGCNTLVKRWEIPTHRQECSFELVPCKHTDIGCKKKIRRKDLEDHEGDSQLHFQSAIDTVRELKVMINDIERENETKLMLLQSRIAMLESTLPTKVIQQKSTSFKFKVEEFSQLKKSSDELFSPVFYTSPGGYKMCICVYANGNGDGEGTHVSVYAYLMRGENDDHLPWPFTGTVLFELLNELEDKNHHSRTSIFPQDNIASQRIMDREIAPTGYGPQYYIPHSSLGYDEAKHCQYLKDDCLYFRVKVNTKTTSKPWLV